MLAGLRSALGWATSLACQSGLTRLKDGKTDPTVGFRGMSGRKNSKKRAKKKDFNESPSGLHLDFDAKSEVPGVSQPGNDIALGCQLVIDGPAPYLTIGFASQDIFDTHGTGDGDDDMHLGGVPFFAEILDRLDQGGPGGEHGVGNDDHPPFQVGAGNIFQADLKAAIPLVLAVGGNKAIIGPVEVVQNTGMEGKSRAENGGYHGLFLEYLDVSRSQRGLHFVVHKR